MTNAELIARLSVREQEVLSLLVEGKSFKTISRELVIAISTVANHASRIYKKLGVQRKEHAIAAFCEGKRTVAIGKLKDWRYRLTREDGAIQVLRDLDALIAS